MAMSEKAKETRRLYMREWRKKNPDKNREYINRFWEKRAAAIQAAQEKETAKTTTDAAEPGKETAI